MAKSTIVGYPRVGGRRELKFWTEDYLGGRLSEDELKNRAAGLRKRQWLVQKQSGLDLIPSNDFSFYDGMLDTACLLGAVPERFKRLGLGELDAYFAMARGYQGGKGDAKALAMKKWFNTNYHYLVPELEPGMKIGLAGEKPFEQYGEALELGIRTKPVLIGPFTFLKLAECRGSLRKEDFIPDFIRAYRAAFSRFNGLGAEWLQMDEPSLATDLDEEDLSLFSSLYAGLLSAKGNLKILLQTYFGDIRDAYREVVSAGFDGIGLDFIEGKKTRELVCSEGFPEGVLLFAGVVNGKNIRRNNYAKTLRLLRELGGSVSPENTVVSTSCSLLHVPYTLENETAMEEKYKIHLAFAQEKLGELEDLKGLLENPYYKTDKKYLENLKLMESQKGFSDADVKKRVSALTEADFIRLPAFSERERLQKEALRLPLLPATTIGSFPQTAGVKALRAKRKKGEITPEQYEAALKEKIANCIALQEEIGLDVLVHGEFERNDMVEYFGENLAGFLFTQNGWVQSYGTRCVKPPVLWSDVKRERPITVGYIRYAQSLTKKPVKGMLTGPVTILNWSFPREDISSREMAYQIALAVKDEIADLEAAGIRIIQIDEAALKEKLPLRRADRSADYLDWAIPAFRLTHASVKPGTQIHTHMCYSEFGDIIREIDAMDADVITFEAARSNLAIVDVLNKAGFKTEVGPGVYDIHSPRVPSMEEIENAIRLMLRKINKEKLWVNPDCGLKTRGEAETVKSLKNMVEAVKNVRKTLSLE